MGLSRDVGPWRTTADCSIPTALSCYRNLAACHDASTEPGTVPPRCRQSEPDQDVCLHTANMPDETAHAPCEEADRSRDEVVYLCAGAGLIANSIDR